MDGESGRVVVDLCGVGGFSYYYSMLSMLFECNMVASEWKYNRIIAEVVIHSRVVVVGCEKR